MRHFGAIACVLIAFAVPGDASNDDAAREQPAPPLAIRIVPSSYQEKTGRVLQRRFHVVITNVSGQPVRLWKEWCSWGYFNLSFVVTGRDGKTFVVKRKPRGWDKNYPDWAIVPPGDHRVFDVSFEDSTWENVPVPPASRLGRVRMKAVYEVPEDEQTRKHRVWTGQAASPEEAYAIYR